MAETTEKDGDRLARELARDLVSHLETVANLHYLLDQHVLNPERMKELRAIEDKTFQAILNLVLGSLQKTGNKAS